MPTAPSRSSAPPSEGDALRVAIVGAGKMARHHAAAIPRCGVAARVVALAEPDARARDAFQELAPGLKTFDSLEALLAGETVDVVHVCTPPPTHERLALAALEAGRHVYVEKPFTETPEQAQKILALAERQGLGVCPGHQLLFEAPARRALELLPSLGELHHVESSFAFRPVRHGAGGSKPLRADLQLLDVLPHPVYSLLHFLELAVPDAETRMTTRELGPGGTVHALLRRGELTAALVVTLEGRPVESYLHLVGTNGTLRADFVRSTVQQLIGPGTSFVDKTLNPYRSARQLAAGTTLALGGRFLRRQASYPGLAEIFEAFYRSIRGAGPPAVSPANIVETVTICQEIGEALADSGAAAGVRAGPSARVAITGGTGFLGAELVRTLVAQGVGLRVLARREPPPWERLAGVDYRVADLGHELPDDVLEGVETVIHLAAETAGGFEEHQRNSVEAAERVCRAAAAAGAQGFVHVSSLAVYAASGETAEIREDTAIEPRARERGAYVWGKVESERALEQLGSDLDIQVKIVRPGAIVDVRSFDPPGRLGRRIGNVFVAVGSPSERLGIVHREEAARLLAWMAQHFNEAPDAINLLAPSLPTKRELVEVLRRANPGLRVIWLPNPVLSALSRLAVLAQKLLRRGHEPVDIQKVFAVDRYDTAAVARLTERVEADTNAPAAPEKLRSA
jgi:predicted dehydrogenase/nucleoside-diphosphate-sugar epimerase